MASILQIPGELFSELYWRFRADYDAAKFTPDAYWTAVADGASRRLGAAEIAHLNEIDGRSWSHPAPIVPQWARDLGAAGIRTAILSNMPVPVRDHIARCSWLPAFDAQIFSCDLGICKPDPLIYAKCLETLSTQPSDILFLDDKEANVRAAQAQGWNAIVFEDAAQAMSEIARRFSLPSIPQ